MTHRWLLPLDTLDTADLPLAGGKNVCIGELHRLGLRTPRGFALSADAFVQHLARCEVDLAELNATDLAAARARVLSTPLSAEVTSAVSEAFSAVDGHISVRSSLYPFEDDPRHSCAGLFTSALNLNHPEDAIEATRGCFGSVFEDHVFEYLLRHELDPSLIRMSVGLQSTVPADASATVFSVDPVTGSRDVMLIDGAHGFGGVTNSALGDSDSYLVEKCRPPRVIARRKGLKARRLVADLTGGLHLIHNTSIGFALDDELLLRIAEDTMRCEAARGGPVDIELAVTRRGELVYVQLRGLPARGSCPSSVEVRAGEETPITTGRCIVHGAGSGMLRRPRAAARLGQTVVIAETVGVVDVPKLFGASALVVRHLPPTSHPAIHLREVGVPTLALEDRFSEIMDRLGQEVTVDCTGKRAALFAGQLPIARRELTELPRPRPPVCLITSYPSPSWSHLLTDGCIEGVHVRGESILYDDVRMHPLALLDFDAEALDGKMRALVERKVAGYPSGAAFYQAKFCERLCYVSHAVGPRRAVTLRLTDLQAADYAALVGGELYERAEQNPKLGLRGAARLTHPRFRRQLDLELSGIANAAKAAPGPLQVLVPMVRSPEELLAIREQMAVIGLNVPLGAMIETVASILRADELAELADFFVVGPGDLAQVVNSADRDHVDVQRYGDPTNVATLRALVLLFERIANREVCLYLPASHYGLLSEHASRLPSTRLGVFTWPDRYLDTAAQLPASTTELTG